MKRFGHAGMEGEHVVKIGQDEYYGFGHDIETSVQSSSGWRKTLLGFYNSLAERDRPAKLSEIVGYHGLVIKLNYVRIAQMLFDLRNK